MIEDKLGQQQYSDANGGMEQGRAQRNPWQDFQWKDDFFYIIDVGQDQRRRAIDALRKYQGWLLLNPLAFIIEEGRKVLVLGQLPNIERWLIMTAVGLLIAWAAFAWFQKTRKGFADVL